MRPALVLLCSPHAGGVSDMLGSAFAAGLEEAGWPASRVALREHPVLPCRGCGACARPPHACVLAGKDEAEWLFSRFGEAPLVVLASSIFFYALPASLKAWIDRGQRFWAARADAPAAAQGTPLPPAAGKPVVAVLAAGRPRGEELFSGAMRTLKWFAPALGAQLVDTRGFRGLDSPADLARRPEVTTEVRLWGREWARRLAAASQNDAGDGTG